MAHLFVLEPRDVATWNLHKNCAENLGRSCFLGNSKLTQARGEERTAKVILLQKHEHHEHFLSKNYTGNVHDVHVEQFRSACQNESLES
eukprot:3281440-Amphidinium_carterae.1